MKTILERGNILTGLPSESVAAAIKRCGQLLVDGDYCLPEYIAGMIRRNESFSVAIGNAIAIPHGENADKEQILHTGLSVLTYPEGVDWGGTQVNLVIGIAAKGDEHMEFLVRIAEVFGDADTVKSVCAGGDVDRILELLGE